MCNEQVNFGDLTVRPASPDDIGQIFSLIKELAEFEKLSSKVTATEELLCDSLFREPRIIETLVASVKDEIVGYAIFFPVFSSYTGRREMFLRDLYIRAQFRNRGYGTQILRHICKLAQERGASRLEWYVSESNKAAITFYRKIGTEVNETIRVCRLEGVEIERFVGRSEEISPSQKSNPPQ